MAKRYTTKDLARELNVSVMTVSRALRGAPDVSPKTRAAVLALAEKHNYQPNAIATSLSSRHSKTLGVIMPDISRHFFSKVLHGIEMCTQQADYKVIICQSNDDYEKEVSDVDTLASARVDGMLVAVSRHTTDMHHFRKVQTQGIPLVLYDRVYDDFPAPKIVSEDYAGAALVVEHLIQRGYRRIAHITCFQKLQISEKRRAGYEATLRLHGLPVDNELIAESDLSVDSGRDATRRLLSLPHPPDAIFAMVDLLGIGAMLAARDCGLRIPQDVAVAGFGNEDVAAWMNPPMTTVEQWPSRMGTLATECLLQQVQASPETWTTNVQTVPTELIVRMSS